MNPQTYPLRAAATAPPLWVGRGPGAAAAASSPRDVESPALVVYAGTLPAVAARVPPEDAAAAMTWRELGRELGREAVSGA